MEWLTTPPSLCCGHELSIVDARRDDWSPAPTLGLRKQRRVFRTLPWATLSSGWAVRLEYGEPGGLLAGVPAYNSLACGFLLQEGQPLWRSHAAGGPEPGERLPDAVRPAAGHDVFHPLPLAPGVLSAALPTAGRQPTLRRASVK